MTKNYGKELILDLHDCDTFAFNRKGLKGYFKELCDLIDMERCDLHFWDYTGAEAEYYKAPIHLRGTSAIQFISTSNIVIHTLDEMKRVYVNIFSCKSFDTKTVIKFTKAWFKGRVVKKTVIDRI